MFSVPLFENFTGDILLKVNNNIADKMNAGSGFNEKHISFKVENGDIIAYINNKANLNNTPYAELENVNLCGQICENSDIFAKNQLLPKTEEGDIVIFREAGAYGYTMSSVYNNRTRPTELLLDTNGITQIRKRETFEDMLSLYTDEIKKEFNL